MSTEEAVRSTWGRIEAWLAGEVPEMAQALRPGASAADLAAFEAELGGPLPADVRASWLLHDGMEETEELQSDLLPALEPEDMAYSPLPLWEMREDWDRMRGHGPEWGWNAAWLPVAGNRGGDYYVVDLSLDGGVQVLEYLHETTESQPVAESFAALLQDLADGLETGRYRYDEDCGIIRPENEDGDDSNS